MKNKKSIIYFLVLLLAAIGVILFLNHNTVEREDVAKVDNGNSKYEVTQLKGDFKSEDWPGKAVTNNDELFSYCESLASILNVELTDYDSDELAKKVDGELDSALNFFKNYSAEKVLHLQGNRPFRPFVSEKVFGRNTEKLKDVMKAYDNVEGLPFHYLSKEATGVDIVLNFSNLDYASLYSNIEGFDLYVNLYPAVKTADQLKATLIAFSTKDKIYKDKGSVKVFNVFQENDKRAKVCLMVVGS